MGMSLCGADTTADVRMKGIHICENNSLGPACTDAKGNRACPAGLRAQILRPNYHDLRFEDNVLDLPEYPQAVWVLQEPYGRSLVFYPRALWEDAVQSGHVVYQGNRTEDGRPLWPFLVDRYFDKPPVWGAP